MTTLQELPVFKVQNASGFDMRQLKFMNQLVQLGIYQIENVRSKQEASEARLIDKGQAVLPISLVQDEFILHIPLNALPTLEKLHIQRCPEMQLCDSKEGFGGFTSLTELIITGCPMLLSLPTRGFLLHYPYQIFISSISQEDCSLTFQRTGTLSDFC